jgi:hypothetical protein
MKNQNRQWDKTMRNEELGMIQMNKEQRTKRNEERKFTTELHRVKNTEFHGGGKPSFLYSVLLRDAELRALRGFILSLPFASFASFASFAPLRDKFAKKILC